MSLENVKNISIMKLKCLRSHSGSYIDMIAKYVETWVRNCPALLIHTQ